MRSAQVSLLFCYQAKNIASFVALAQIFLDFYSRTGKDSSILKDRYLTKHLFEDLGKKRKD